MCRKMYFLLSVILLLSITTIGVATTATWDRGAGTSDWNTGQNWSPDGIPPSAYYAAIPLSAGPVITTGETIGIFRINLQGAGNGTLTVNGGTLNVSNHIYVAALPADRGTLNMSSGTINMTGTTSTLYIGRDAGSVGIVNLDGGIITCKTLNMGASGGTEGRINMTEGTLIINGDATVTIAPWIANGWIKAYGGAGTVNVDYDNINLGKTTVTATPPTKAVAPTPANNATKVTTVTDLSWMAMLDATSHDVYFGTTNTPEFQGNQTALTFDPGTLTGNTTYYWRIDEVTPGGTVTGDVWSFSTGNTSATNPGPADNTINVAIAGTNLTWTPGVSAESHDVYFGTTNPPASVGNQAAATYNPGTMATNTTYYWRVDEVQGSNTYTGPVWSFTTADPISKGPYLIYPGNNTEMTVLWQLPITQSCTLDWGTDTSYSNGTTSTTEYGTYHQHKYTITGLTPGTKYYYRVTTPWTVATGSFLAAPASDATNVKFLAFGDTRSYPASVAQITARMNAVITGDPAYQTVLLHSGDYSNIDDEITWTNEYFSRLYPATLQLMASVPIMGCLGNHETNAVTPANMIDKYYPYPYAQPVSSGRFYSFDYGPVHVAVVDQETASYAADSPQILWLTSDLAASTKKWKFIVLHAPGWTAYGPGAHPNDATVQTVIQPLCEQYGVQVVFAGHNHFYSRAVVNGVHHVTTGAGGASFYRTDATRANIVTATANALEFCKISASEDTLSVQAMTDTGAVLDQFFVTDTEPELTFVQVTDVQIGMCTGADTRWQTAINKINLIKPAFVIDTGDHVQNWSTSAPYTAQLNSYLNIASGVLPGTPIYRVPGNHDIGDSPTTDRYANYLSVFPNGSNVPWYSFSYGNTLFICLDTETLKNPSGCLGADANEMNWLTTTLENSSGYAHKIVFTHISPCLTSTTEMDQTFNLPSIPGNGRAYDNIRAELLNLFHQYGVEAVFSGHYHVPAYVNDNGLDIVTTMSSTCPLGSYLTSDVGIRIVKIYPDHIEHTYRTYASMPALMGDFNSDGIVDLKDLGSMTGNWLDNNMWP